MEQICKWGSFSTSFRIFEQMGSFFQQVLQQILGAAVSLKSKSRDGLWGDAIDWSKNLRLSTLDQSELGSCQVETEEVLKLGQILPVDLTSFLSRQNKDMRIIYLEKDIRSPHGHISMP